MFTDGKYLAIEKKFNDLKAEFKKHKDSGQYNNIYLSKLKNDYERVVKDDVQKYYDERINELRGEQKKVLERYESQQKPKEPTAELLKRQEWELELKLADIHELRDKVKHFMDTGEGEKVYLNMLRLALREKGLHDEETKVIAYTSAYNVEAPYKNDESYINAENSIMKINQVKHTGYLHIGEGENRRVVSLTL